MPNNEIAMTIQRSSKSKSPLLALIRLMLRLYPQRFRHRFEEEIWQTIKDEMRHDALFDSSSRRVKKCIFLLFDLLLSICREHYDQWRHRMQKKTYPLYVFGTALVCYWLVVFAWAMLKAFAGLTIPAPEDILLGREPSNLTWAVYDASLFFGPIVALLFLLLPLIRLEWNGPDGNLMVSVAIRQASLWHKLFLLMGLGICGFILTIAALRTSGMMP